MAAASRITPPVARVREGITNVNSSLIERSAPDQCPPVRTDWILLQELNELGSRAAACGNVVCLAFEFEYDGMLGPTKPARSVNDAVEHLLQISWRAADDLK